MPDLMAIILALSRIQTDLRMLQAQPDRYPVDGHYEHLIDATSAMGELVDRWMCGDRVAADRRHTERREQEERRHDQRRHEQTREVA